MVVSWSWFGAAEKEVLQYMIYLINFELKHLDHKEKMRTSITSKKTIRLIA